jgi:hypothetical protein
MAVTTYGVNHPMAVKLWSRKLFYEIFKETWVSKFIGEDSNSLVQIKNETGKGPVSKATTPRKATKKPLPFTTMHC